MSQKRSECRKKENFEWDRSNSYILMERECRENIDLYNEKSDNKILAIELIITTFFLGIAFSFLAPKISQTIQEAGINSGKQVLLE